MDDLSTFQIVNADGSQKEFRVLFLFQNDLNDRKYIVYTDNTFSPKGLLNVFASIYEGDLANIVLYPIETRAEWRDVEAVLNILDQDGQLKGPNATYFVRVPDEEVSSLTSILKTGTPDLYAVMAMFREVYSKAEYVIATRDEENTLEDNPVEIGRVVQWDVEHKPAEFEEIVSPQEWQNIYEMVSTILNGFEDNLPA